MNTNYIENWNELAKKIQEPFLAMTDLNLKTLQGFSYIKPQEYIQAKKPEDLLEKQVNLAIENGHKTLDYIQKSFTIFEKTLHNLTKDIH